MGAPATIFAEAEAVLADPLAQHEVAAVPIAVAEASVAAVASEVIAVAEAWVAPMDMGSLEVGSPELGPPPQVGSPPEAGSARGSAEMDQRGSGAAAAVLEAAATVTAVEAAEAAVEEATGQPQLRQNVPLATVTRPHL